MEPLMQKKREGATYVPYKRVGGEVVFFLQKREEDAERAPGMIGTFGGGIEEGEDPLAALYREMQEELTYTPQHPIYFSRYEFMRSVFHVFLEEVDDNFESHIDVKEGEYGRFFTLQEIEQMPNVTASSRLITAQLAMVLADGSLQNKAVRVG